MALMDLHYCHRFFERFILVWYVFPNELKIIQGLQTLEDIFGETRGHCPIH